MSRYEVLQTEFARLRALQATAVMLPAGVIAVPLIFASRTFATVVFVSLAALVVLPLILHQIWRAVFRSYREWSDRSAQISTEIVSLRHQVGAVFDKYRARQKGEHFKQAYGLAGRPVRALEEALSVGMFREGREVFVTAFMCSGVAVRVTASIGSPFRCSASDNPAHWKDHVRRLECDEIRQYHNHPVHNGRAEPSNTDVRTSHLLMQVLGSHSGKLRSFIICWNGIREWKVFEYDQSGRHWLHFEFDASI